jgi:hypothetical protein
MKMSVLFLASIVFPFASAMAEKANNFTPADTSESFALVVTSVRTQMESGGRFEFITPVQKAAANRDLDGMAAMLQKSGSVAAMGEREKVALFNLQEHVNGILTHSDSERMVCERANAIGSHIQTNNCRTFGDIQRERLDTKRFVDQTDNMKPQLTSERCPIAQKIAQGLCK